MQIIWNVMLYSQHFTFHWKLPVISIFNAFEDCDFLNEVFSFEFFYTDTQAHEVYMRLVLVSICLDKFHQA